MKVLHVSHTRDSWGAEQVVLNVAPHLAEMGISQALACPPGGTFEQRWRELGFEYLPVEFPHHRGIRAEDGTRPGPVGLAREGWVMARSVGLIRRAIARAGADIAHAHTKNALVEVALGARVARRRGVLHLHDLVAPGVGRRLQGKAVGWSSATVAISRAVAACVEGPVSSKVTVVPNGIDLARFTPGSPPEGLRAELTGDASAPLVVEVCRLAPKKGVHRLVEAVAELDGVHLVVVGDAPPGSEQYAATMQADARARMGERIHFAGRRSDVVDILRCADVFAHAADAEPFGLVLAEAQACGIAVVASDGGGAPEVVGDAGLLVPSGDVPALREAIGALLADPARRQDMAGHGRAQAEAIGDSATQARRLAEIYRSIV